jgi:hypothetical protein
LDRSAEEYAAFTFELASCDIATNGNNANKTSTILIFIWYNIGFNVSIDAKIIEQVVQA